MREAPAFSHRSIDQRVEIPAETGFALAAAKGLPSSSSSLFAEPHEALERLHKRRIRDVAFVLIEFAGREWSAWRVPAPYAVH
jgi:hypothetical protein